MVQLDYDEELGPLHGMYGSMQAEFEVQRTIKRAELTAFFCLLKKVVGPNEVDVDNKVRSHLAQVGIQAPGLSFRCICHLGNPIKTRFESGFCLLCTSHGPCCLLPYHQVWEIRLHRSVSALCGGIWIQSWEEASYAQSLWENFPAAERHIGRFLPRPVTSRRSRNTSPAMSRRSSVVSWSDSPRDHAVPKSEDAVMEDCTESHQAEINKKIIANDKLTKILTNMPDEHTSLIYGDSLKAKIQSLDDEKVALLAAKRQFLPLPNRIEKQKNYLERIFREIETKQQHRLEILQKWIEAEA